MSIFRGNNVKRIVKHPDTITQRYLSYKDEKDKFLIVLKMKKIEFNRTKIEM